MRKPYRPFGAPHYQYGDLSSSFNPIRGRILLLHIPSDSRFRTVRAFQVVTSVEYTHDCPAKVYDWECLPRVDGIQLQ